MLDTIRGFGKKVLDKKNSKSEVVVESKQNSGGEKAKEATTLTYEVSKKPSSSGCC